METVKKIALRVLFGAVTLLALNFIYMHTFWRQDLEDSGGELLPAILNAQDSADVIYLAESSNWSNHESDSSKRSISEFTSDYFPSLKFRSVQKGGIHAGIYLSLIKHLKKNARVKTLIVTMNLRSFDAAWINSKLETPLMRSKVMYSEKPPVINRFLLALNTFENKTEEQRDIDLHKQWERDELKFPYEFKYKNVIEWDKAMGNGGYVDADGKWDMPKIELACHYIKTYAFQINTETNPRIKDFDNIVKVCKEKGLNLVFNLMAENLQYADSLVGKDLIYLIKQNHDLLMSRYNKDDVMVVDNLELVDGKEYIDQNWTTEHYKQKGRMIIAKNLAAHLKKIYPQAYIDRTN